MTSLVRGLAYGVAGGVFGVAAGVRCVAETLVEAIGDDCEEKVLEGGAFSGDAEGPTLYERRARVDQVLAFFEMEHDRYKGYVQDADGLEALRVEYYNCVNAVEFQHELIAQLVEELLDLRRRIREPGLDPAARKEMCIRFANIRLDISDRKTKRFFKEKDRRAIHAKISPMIAEAKVQRLLEEQASASREAEETSAAGSRKADSSFTESEAWGTSMESHAGSNLSRRKKKYYSDDELAALLREKDQ
mmetsp:Transcript_12456/g.36983  ORF Transcript_12456/g.36983 Transcript_12456/m.36983 type:complete len:247 (-) Transcript_12456:61-801(-)